MFLRVQGNVWYNLEHHSTLRNDSTAAESSFCRFLENEAPKQSKLVKKSFFSKFNILKYQNQNFGIENVSFKNLISVELFEFENLKHVP